MLRAMVHPLDGVRLKLVRAQEHMETALRILDGIRDGHCHLVPQQNEESRFSFLEVRLFPKSPLALSVVIGDFLFNARSALDHLVWQLVLNNPPNRPSGQNMFPITTKPDKFTGELERGRLNGVSKAVKTLIEGLQPYHTGNEILARFSALHNADKHRTLNVTTMVADKADFLGAVGDNPVIRLILSGAELRDGRPFGNLVIPFDSPEEFGNPAAVVSKVKMEGKVTLFVAFDEAGDSLEDEVVRVDTTLQGILEFVRETIIPTFEPYFD
jgi:hypothetical protein